MVRKQSKKLELEGFLTLLQGTARHWSVNQDGACKKKNIKDVFAAQWEK